MEFSSGIEMLNIISLTVSKFITLAILYVVANRRASKEKKSSRDAKKTTKRYDDQERENVSNYVKETIDELVVNHLGRHVRDGYTDKNRSEALYSKFPKVVCMLRHNRPMLSDSSKIVKVDDSHPDRWIVRFEKNETWVYDNIDNILSVYFSLNQ